ncbi:hypothetical protein P22_0619 [Propionispora sp. 2/2-37]|uniref:hypothetical protein n=1 Tax=Propionispora sp. 2/2-37 TaxID=1677858 RepID=UPI0006BB9233|nr:hypothetical protein [Propionispora sp. 2/2-37]CUH94553.1 hypothetical protein P22_0619 [Propionispora sp. 2/2-37]
MSISSVNDSSWLYEIYYRNSFSNTQAGSAQFTSGIADSDETSTTLDSDAAQSLFSGVMSQGILPVATSESGMEENSLQTQLDDSGQDAVSGLTALAMMPPAPPMIMPAETSAETGDTVSGATEKNQDTMSRMMPPPPNDMGSLSGSSEDTEDTTNSTSLLQQVLNMAVQSYENTGTAWDSASWSS